jgi:hypothetical protein
MNSGFFTRGKRYKLRKALAIQAGEECDLQVGELCTFLESVYGRFQSRERLLFVSALGPKNIYTAPRLDWEDYFSEVKAPYTESDWPFPFKAGKLYRIRGALEGESVEASTLKPGGVYQVQNFEFLDETLVFHFTEQGTGEAARFESSAFAAYGIFLDYFAEVKND